ncbi:MAG: CPXCG motif-containing cysteine-rich protein [Ignavibacteriaceae bacterium]
MKKNRQTDEYVQWICQYCGEENETWIDLTVDGPHDLYEECSICSRPNSVIIEIDEENRISVHTKFTDE